MEAMIWMDPDERWGMVKLTGEQQRTFIKKG
jgi:hypothetical protein